MTAYGRAALDGLLAELAEAGSGERNVVLNRVAFRAGQLVAAGVLEVKAAAQDLEAQALALGLTRQEVATTLRSALQSGMASPASIPDHAPPGQRKNPVSRPVGRPEPPKQEPPSRPPRAEVDRLWRDARPPGLTLVAPPQTYLDGNSYLRHRGWWPADVAALELVRILPGPEYPWANWWPWGRAGRWILTALLYEPDGQPVSVHARAVDFPGDPLPAEQPKCRSPRGYSTRGLLMANSDGLELLRGQATPARVVIVEGLTDLVAMARYAARKAEQPAVLGLLAGSASALAHVRWPGDCTVALLTDDDAAGDRYAAAARAAIPERIRVLRGNLS